MISFDRVFIPKECKINPFARKRDLLICPHIEELVEISRSLRRDRELAFYGSEDLTPSDFYRKPDAEAARAGSRRVVEAVTAAVKR